MKNKRMIDKKWMALMMLPVTLASFSSPTMSWARGGHAEGNGGDGVYVEGKLTLRDFIDSNSGRLVQIYDNAEFLKSAKDFIPLLQDIAFANPDLALGIWNQLMEARLWKTRTSLPVLPDGVTAYVGPKAEVQIAIREDNDIVISQDAFARVEQSYVLAHEALHGVIDGKGAMHHERVRAVVRYLRDNRGKYNSDELERVLVKNGAYVSRRFSVIGFDKEVQEIINSGIAAYLKGTGSEKARCGIKEAIESIYFTDISRNFAPPINVNCEEQDYISTVREVSPVLGEVAVKMKQNLNTVKRPFDFEWLIRSVYKPSWWSRNADETVMTNFRNSCKVDAGVKKRKELADYRAQVTEMLEIEGRAKTEVKRIKSIDASLSFDPAATLFVQILTSIPLSRHSPERFVQVSPYLENIDQTIQSTTEILNDLSSLEQRFQQNVQTCTEVFGTDYEK